MEDLLDVFYLYKEEVELIKNKRLLTDFHTYAEYKDVAKDAQDHEMLRAVKIVEKYSKLPDLIKKMRTMETQDHEEAKVTLTTAHRSKGLEFSSVKLGDDFPSLLESDSTNDVIEDEINLLYVASTRAINNLEINDAVYELQNLKKQGKNLFDERANLASKKEHQYDDLKSIENKTIDEIIRSEVNSISRFSKMF